MSTLKLLRSSQELVYPESDGQPMADNSVQFRWMVVLFGNLAALFRDATDVLVGGNLFWYPREGHPEICNAPDVYVVFGRPKGDRGSYRQWEEDNVPMTVVFEILSPVNTALEIVDKLDFYDEYGVEEYYLFDPEKNRLVVYRRGAEILRRVRKADGFVSPRLGIRFDLSGKEMMVYRPDGQQFFTFEELDAERETARQQAEQARQQAEQERQRTEQARQRGARLAELSRKARQQQASPEELAELERLEDEAGSWPTAQRLPQSP